jgi:23S rRNA (guanosine2251-2'-O)-methyltransferase
MIKLNAKELRTSEPDLDAYAKIPKHDITIILDNVLDTYNVGSIFRLADAVAVKEVYLCGETLTPPNSRIKKASINTWQWVSWKYAPTAVEAVAECRRRTAGCRIIAVEQDARSISFQKIEFTEPLAIIVGNETYGVSQEALNLCDKIVELPMWGVNKSLNVMVSTGIVLYEIMKQIGNTV